MEVTEDEVGWLAYACSRIHVRALCDLGPGISPTYSYLFIYFILRDKYRCRVKVFLSLLFDGLLQLTSRCIIHTNRFLRRLRLPPLKSSEKVLSEKLTNSHQKSRSVYRQNELNCDV